MITTKHDFEVIWRIKLSDGFFYYLKTDIVEDIYMKIVGGVEDIFLYKRQRGYMMGKPITKEEIVNALYSVCLAKGHTVMVHTALSKMGYVCGGAQAVIEALI